MISMKNGRNENEQRRPIEECKGMHAHKKKADGKNKNLPLLILEG